MQNKELSLTAYNDLIVDWGKEKGILPSLEYSEKQVTLTNTELVVLKQALKLQEEMGELAGAIVRGKPLNLRDALGDVFVVWSMLCHATDNDPHEVVQEVYDIISKRKGEMKDGAFIKQEDLDKEE